MVHIGRKNKTEVERHLQKVFIRYYDEQRRKRKKKNNHQRTGSYLVKKRTRLPQTKGGIIAFVLTVLPFIDDYTTRS